MGMGIREAFEFMPNEEQMLRCLLNRVSGSCSLAWSCDDDLIGTEDLFGSKEPWEIFGGNRKEKERLFFTELKRIGKGKTKGRICRTVGKGFWSNKGQRTWIHDQNGRIIGCKRGFRYERRKGQTNASSSSSDCCDWLMKEYLLPEYVMRRVKEKFSNCALCLLKRKKKKKKKKGSGRPVLEEEEPPIDAAADFKITREWLRQQLGDDVLIDDDDDASPCDRAAENDDQRLDNLTVVEEEECSIPVVVVVPKEMDECLSAEDVDCSDSVQLPTTEDQSSIAPPFDDLSMDFDFGDYRAAPCVDHFAAWDDAPPYDRAAVVTAENDDQLLDNLTVVEEECTIPVVDVPSSSIDESLHQQTSRAEDDDGSHNVQLPPVTTVDQCSITPPFDLEGQNTDFDFVDYRAADHFAAWDDDVGLFGDYYHFPAWAGMLPVSVV